MELINKIQKKYKIIGMAYSRSEFKNKVEEKVGGAFFEYLKAQYTKANKEEKWVMHWETEVTRLLDSELVVVLLHTSSFKNKRKAANEVIDLLKRNAASYKSSAKKQLETSYFKRKFKHELSEDKIAAFFTKAELTISQHTV